MRRSTSVLLALCATFAAAAPARAADEVIASVDRPTLMSAYGGGLLFSVRDAQTGRYRLWYTEPLRPPAPLPGIAPRSVPFDADLGPGLNGRFLAVYSRCTREPTFDVLNTNGSPPDYTTGRGCDIYQYDFTAKRETKLRNASSPRASEVLPAVWKTRVAFARVYDGGSKSYLYERPRTGGGASRRMPAGSVSRDTRYRAHPTSMDLYGRRLAFAWTYGSGERDTPASQIRMDDTQTKVVTTVDNYGGGGLTTIERATPGFNSSKLYYARLCKGDPGGCAGRSGIMRVRYSTGDALRAVIGRYDLGIALGNRSQGEATVYVLRDANGFRACYDPESKQTPAPATCTIVATSPEYG